MRFSANIGFLYAVRALAGRIHAAAGADFKTVEMHLPNDTPAREVRVTLAATGVAMLGINTLIGALLGDFGLAGLSGSLIESINQRDKSAYMLRNVAQVPAVIGEVGRSNIKRMFNFCHVQATKGYVIKQIEAALFWMGHVHTAACPSCNEPEEGEFYCHNSSAQLKSLDYDSWVRTEYKPCGRTGDSLVWLKDRRSSYYD